MQTFGKYTGLRLFYWTQSLLKWGYKQRGGNLYEKEHPEEQRPVDACAGNFVFPHWRDPGPDEEVYVRCVL